MGSSQRRDKSTCLRTKTGCLTCRLRKKKCDELRPTCTGCARNFIDCQWPVPANPDKSSKRTKPDSGLARRKDRQPSSRSTTASAGVHDIVGQPGAITFIFDRYSPKPPGHAPSPCPSPVGGVDLHDSDGDEKPGSIIFWQPLTASFLSTERALLLNSSSILLLQHYLEATSTFLVAKPLSSNPFITLVLPLAYSDDLLMHAVLALSGTHLSYKKRDDLKIQLATRQHYSLLLRNLRSLFADESSHDDVRRTLRLLLVLVVLCHVEAISGEPHGGIFPHLWASRELVLKLLQEPQRTLHDDIKLVKGFALEVYFYLVLVNSITPYGRDKARVLPFDSFCSSLDFLKEYETFGVFFSCGQGLFEMISQVSILATKRLTEEESGVNSPETRREYELLIDTITEWQSPPVAPEMAEWQAEHVWTGEIYRQALLMFIETSMCGSVVNNPKVIVAIQRHIDTAFPLFVPVAKSPFITILLWPIMIVGSCLISHDQRREYIRLLRTKPRVDISQVSEAATLMEYLWEDDDERAYGPFGLDFVMRKHHINFSMA
ncbi:Fungal Zn2-Cys6 binuclear cluster domain-containing protein [Cladophialophora immunda]|nr:Fungal Zn2-Cys6 binuclear cluster domain-containing protein [Cladophialophora immunda]